MSLSATATSLISSLCSFFAGVEFLYQLRSRLALFSKFLDGAAEFPDAAGIAHQPEAKREQQDQAVDDGNGSGSDHQFGLGEQRLDRRIDAEEGFLGVVGLPRDITLFGVSPVSGFDSFADPGCFWPDELAKGMPSCLAVSMMPGVARLNSSALSIS